MIVRGAVGEGAEAAEGDVFVIDSPVLPDELDALPALLEQARLPGPERPAGDTRRLGSPARPRSPSQASPLGCAESTAERLQSSPGEAQRELRSLRRRARDRATATARARLAVQALPVPGRLRDRRRGARAARRRRPHAATAWPSRSRGHARWSLGDYLSTGRDPDAQRRRDDRCLSGDARAPASAGRATPSTSSPVTAPVMDGASGRDRAR